MPVVLQTKVSSLKPYFQLTILTWLSVLRRGFTLSSVMTTWCCQVSEFFERTGQLGEGRCCCYSEGLYSSYVAIWCPRSWVLVFKRDTWHPTFRVVRSVPGSWFNEWLPNKIACAHVTIQRLKNNISRRFQPSWHWLGKITSSLWLWEYLLYVWYYDWAQYYVSCGWFYACDRVGHLHCLIWYFYIFT